MQTDENDELDDWNGIGQNSEMRDWEAELVVPKARKLAVFSEETNRKNVLIKLLEVFTICFGVVQVLALVYFTFCVCVLLFVVAMFGAIAVPPLFGVLVLLIFFLAGISVISFSRFMFALTVGFAYRQKAALFKMVVCTVVTSIIAYFVIPVIPRPNEPPFLWLRLFLLFLSFQYVPCIVVGLLAFRLFRDALPPDRALDLVPENAYTEPEA